jgi:hypothetical protein
MTITGYKGFDKHMKCNGIQFHSGGEYEEKDAIVCQMGFHFCENPLDVLGYYPPSDSRYAEVEGDGKIDKHGSDSKVACSKLRVGVEIGLSGLISAGVKFILDKVDWTYSASTNTGYYSAATNTGNHSASTNTGHQSAATNTGYNSAATNTGNRSVATNTGHMSAATNTGNYSASTNTGNRSVATNTGYNSAATNTGYQSVATNTGDNSTATVDGHESVASSLGIKGNAKGTLGCWLVLAEWEMGSDRNWHRKDVQCVLVDGEKIKADTYYQLVNGEFVECE